MYCVNCWRFYSPLSHNRKLKLFNLGLFTFFGFLGAPLSPEPLLGARSLSLSHSVSRHAAYVASGPGQWLPL